MRRGDWIALSILVDTSALAAFGYFFAPTDAGGAIAFYVALVAFSFWNYVDGALRNTKFARPR